MSSTTPIRLSKSRVMSGVQCAKRLWLEMHEPWRATIDAGLMNRFDTGHRVGEVARSLYSEGRLIGHVDDLAAALAETQAALADDGDLLLFEPAFRHGDVLVRADLLFRHGGRYRLVEVKAATSVMDHHLQDAAIQAWVIEGAGYPVDGVSIAHIDSSFVYPGGGDYRGLLKSVDVTDRVASLRAEVPALLLRCQQVVAGPMPDIVVGKQCDAPYACPFLAWCDRDRPPYPLSILGTQWRLRDQLAEQGYRDLRDVPEVAIGNGLSHRIWSAAISGVPFTDACAGDLLRDLPYPRYYIDFETIQFAVPIWPGTRPYEQLPFQWSCTIEHADGTHDHREFLDTSGDAPMRTCLRALVAAIGEDGPVFAYTGFEGRVLREGRARHPELAPALDAIAARLVDLHAIARSHYYHPAQNSSWSIKRVLPTIAPDLDYANLGEVADGGSAQLAYLEMVNRDAATERRTQLADALRVYCRRDTLGMLRIAQHFITFTGGSALSENNGSGPSARDVIFPILTARFTEAFAFASLVHSAQARKGTAIPYLSHLMAVASLVIEHGGDEDMAIAALLHDAAEDQGGYPMLDQIRARFGDRVAAIVEGCTDTFEDPKPDYVPRKQAYIDHLKVADLSVCVVAAADKLHNARAILADFRSHGAKLWERFTADSATLHWYYREVAHALHGRLAGHRAHAMVEELQRIVACVWAESRERSGVPVERVG